MKLGLFLLSLSGFIAAGYFFTKELNGNHDLNQMIYMVLLAIILCKGIVGMILTSREVFDNRRRLAQY